MATSSLTPKPPPGFVLESAAGDIPPPPAGFEIEARGSEIPAPPAGFVPDSPSAERTVANDPLVTSPETSLPVGIAETALQMGTGLGSAFVGTVGGAIDLALGRGTDKALDTFHTATREGTYQPRTVVGKKISGALAWPFEKAEELGAEAGDVVLEKTGSPGAATAAHVGVAAVPYAVGAALGLRRGKRGEAEEANPMKANEKPAEARAETGEPLTTTVPETIPTVERGAASVERRPVAEEITPSKPLDDLPALQARLDRARRFAAESKNGDIKSEWERVAYELEQEIASREKTAASTRIDEAAHEAATSPRNDMPEPTDAMKRAGNYAKGHVTLNGLDISIENPKGSVRSGVDADGKPWSNTMQSHYGYIKRTMAKDGDHVDVFLGPKAEDPVLPVYIVDQVNPKTWAFDEVKVLLGYEGEEAARAGYLANYAKDWQGIGRITETSLGELKDWLKGHDTRKPFAQSRPAAYVPRTSAEPAEAAADVLYVEFAGQRHPVKSFKDASEKWDEFRTRAIEGGAGSRDVPNALVTDKQGKAVGHIAWNGRVFEGSPKDWTRDTKVLYDNRKPKELDKPAEALLPETAADTVPRSVGAMEAEAITPQTRLDAALGAVATSAKRGGRDVVDVTGGKAITYLDDLAKRSPTAKKLRDAMEYTEFSWEPIAPSYYERVSLKTGELIGRLENSLEPLRGAFRRHIPKEVNARLVAILRGEKLPRTGGVKGMGEVGLKVRQILNDTRDYAKSQGIEVGFLPNYFPRVYKRQVLETDKGRADFVRVLQRHGIEATEADAIATKIVNTDGILMIERAPKSERFDPVKPREAAPEPHTPGRMLRDRARVNKNIETARTLSSIPDAELASFLESDVPAVLVRYVTGVVRRAEYARLFGPGEGRLNAMLRDIITEAAQAGRPVRPAEIKRIYDLADAMQSAYRPILSHQGRTANTLMGAYQLIRTLPLATISSLSEPFLIIARGRPGALPKALAFSLKHTVHETIRGVFRKFPKAEATKALEDIGLGLDAALSERLTASFGGEVTRVTNAFFKLNFLHQFTRFNRVLGNEVGKLMVERHLKDLSKGVGERRARQLRHELAELGVDASKGMAWIERGAAKTDPFFDTVKAAGLRFTNEVVMNPRPTNRPMWHSNPHYHLLAQLKGYQTVFGNTTLTRWYDLLFKRGAYQGARNAVKIATAGILMVFTAVLGNEVREVIKYGPGGNPKFKDETPTRTIYRAMERAGFLGIFQFVSDAMFAHRFGSPAIAQLAGPAASQVNEMIEATGKAAEGKARPLAREVANAIPIANVIPAARRGITEAIAPESRRDRRERR